MQSKKETIVKEAVTEYKKFLAEAQLQHQKTIEEASAKLESLISVTTESDDISSPDSTPQSVWITGNDNERFLMLNEVAAAQINNLFEQLNEVIQLLAKREQGT